MSDLDLVSYFQITHELLKIGHFSLTELEKMIPFEWDIYSSLSMRKESEQV